MQSARENVFLDISKTLLDYVRFQDELNLHMKSMYRLSDDQKRFSLRLCREERSYLFAVIINSNGILMLFVNHRKYFAFRPVSSHVNKLTVPVSK